MAILVIIIIVVIAAILESSGSSNNHNNKSKNSFYSGSSVNSGSAAVYKRTSSYARSSYKKSNYRKSNVRSRESLNAKREQFEEMKQTDFFKKWKKAQYACQDGKCAYCENHIDLHSPNTQVDHVRPLCKYGTNEYDNLVLACKECNYYCKKGDYTWRDARGHVHSGWEKPAWIKKNYVLENAKSHYVYKTNSYDASSYYKNA